MEIESRFSRSNPLIERAGYLFAMLVLVCSASIVSAQNEYWPVATLQPQGLGAQITPIAGVALAGDVAVTVYQQTPTLGYRVFLRKRNAQQAWDVPQLLVQGQPGEGEGVTVSADADHIAIGLPKVDTNGRVDVFLRNGTNWTLQQRISAAPGAPPAGGTTSNFGTFVSIAGSLLTVSSTDLFFSSQHDTYRYDSTSGSWVDAGFSQWNPLSTSTIARTDGHRVLACYNTACVIRLFDAAGSIPGGGSVPFLGSFATADEWIFGYADGALGAYQLSANAWTLRQQFGTPSSYAATSGKLMLRPSSSQTTHFYEVDGSGVWQMTATAQDPSLPGGKAINQSFALSGTQSFARRDGTWLPSGTIEGVVDVSSFWFGYSVTLAANHVWIGSPLYNRDYQSGAVWMEPLDGNSSIFPRNLDAPLLHASNAGFGHVIATDGLRVAVASKPTIAMTPLEVRVYSASSISPLVAEITVPGTLPAPYSVDVDIDGDTLALLRLVNGSPSEVFIYVDSGAGYVLNQTLQLPGVSIRKIVLSGDLLAVGQSQFQRIGGTNGDFSPVDPIVNPLGLTLNFARMARSGNLLVVAANFPAAGEPLARSFSLTSGGWVYSGDVNRGAFPDAQCTFPAIDPLPGDGANMIACVVGNTLSLATPNPIGSDWTVTRSANVPGLINGPGSINAVAIDGDHVAIGESSDSRVVVVDISETILNGGFDR